MSRNLIVTFNKLGLCTLNQLYIIIIIILPILNQYKIFSLRIIDIFNILTFVFFLLSSRKIRLYNYFLPYMIYIIFTTLIIGNILNLVSFSIVINNILSFSFLAFNMYIVAIDKFDVDYAYMVYSKIVFATAAIVVLEVVVNLLTSYRPVLVFPYLTLNYGDNIYGTEFIRLVQYAYVNYRASAFMLEPAAVAELLLPWLFLTIFNLDSKNDRRTILSAVLVSFSICITTSFLGMIGCLIVWSLYLEKSLFERGKKKLFVIVPVLLVAGYFLFTMESVQNQIISKMYSMENLTVGTSLSWRLFRGWYCFNELPEINQIFGCGYSMLAVFFKEYSITTILDKGELVSTYMNGISLLLCTGGIVGTILYMMPLLKMVCSNKTIVPLFICWVLLQFTAQVFDSPCYFILLLFIIKLSLKKCEGTVKTL